MKDKFFILLKLLINTENNYDLKIKRLCNIMKIIFGF